MAGDQDYATVSGTKVHRSDFAYVGDPDDKSTWKLPIHDEAHAKNALARFNQTDGIPSDKKDGVWKKIVAACKKFGIKVSEENSLRSGMAHKLTEEAILEVENEEAVMAALHARARMVEIELSLQ